MYTRRSIFRPSAQQKAVFDWAMNGRGSAILEAAAGCGKSTTLLNALPFMDGMIFYGLYNRRTCDEIRGKAAQMRVDRPGVVISTMHSSGYSTIRKLWPGAKVQDSKVGLIIDQMIESDPQQWGDLRVCRVFVTKMVSFAKQFLVPLPGSTQAQQMPRTDMRHWETLMSHYSVEEELPDGVDPLKAISLAEIVFAKSHAKCEEMIDFDDMLYAPIVFNLRFFKNDWVLMDEYQDTNPARLEIATRLLKPGGRFIGVGDRRQSIYGFTGALSDAFDRAKERFNCIVMPLSITYRCPKAVVSYVHQFVGPDHIQAAETAPEGIVRQVAYDPKKVGADTAPMPWFMQDRPENTSAILCRYTSPLVRTAYAMLREGVACKIEGRDVGRSIINLAKRWRVKTLDALETRLIAYLIREGQAARKEKSDKRLQDAVDKVETLHVFIGRARKRGERTIDGIEQDVNNLFADDVRGVVTLSTGHKAKGREWPRVYWIMTKPRQRHTLKPWEAEQETNISYVIGSRAMAELVFVAEEMTERA